MWNVLIRYLMEARLKQKTTKKCLFHWELGRRPKKFIRRKFSPSVRQFYSSRWNLKQRLTIRVMFSLPPPWLCRVFLHDVTAAILVSQNNEMAAMLVSQTNPPHLHKCWPREWKRSISHLLVNQSELEVAVTTSCLKKHVKTRKIVRSVLGQNSSTISLAMRR